METERNKLNFSQKQCQVKFSKSRNYFLGIDGAIPLADIIGCDRWLSNVCCLPYDIEKIQKNIQKKLKLLFKQVNVQNTKQRKAI